MKNIAECQRRIKLLNAEREAIYNSRIALIDTEIAKLTDSIKLQCKHHHDFLIIDHLDRENEFGDIIESWQETVIECTVCGKYRTIASSWLKQHTDAIYAELLELTCDEATKLK